VQNTASKPPARLLVADDEEGLLFLMVDALRREGWEVEGFPSGAETLDWLKDHEPDLLLLDLKLSDLSALELVEQLRREGRELPFIIVTGHGDERTAVEAMKSGALDYVMKDAGMLELLPSTIRRALGVIEREHKLVEAHETVRQGKERHQQVVETALDGFLRFDQHGKLLEVNRALCGLLDRTEESLLGRDVFDPDGLAFREDVRTCLDHLDAGQAIHCFTRLARRNGEEIEVEISLHRETQELFGFVHDITAQRRLERQMLRITLDERRRFGQELHDGLGQQLTAIEMMTHSLARQLKATVPKEAKVAFEITNYIRRAVTQTRELAHDLSPVAEGGEGLMNALQEVARMTTMAGVECKFECSSVVKVEDPGVASHLHRIAQEAVTNALKHARASLIRIRLEDTRDNIVLTILDDGRGLPRGHASHGGMGLEVIQHRAVLIGGQVSIKSGRDKGVCVTCKLPKT